ncbi:MAG TPA: DNA polymerase III subunit beta [Bacillota bacterium]|nr:DNA polymerase III subunit beta [Bacillota bacterium]
MKIVCEQSELSSFLQIAARALSTKSTLPILTGILIETQDNQLRCVTTDLEISIEVMVPGIQVFEPGSLVLPGKTFVEIIRHLPSGPIEIKKENTNNMVTISGKHSSFQLPLLSREEFPVLPEKGSGQFIEINGIHLKEAIKQTIYATLADDPRPFLSSILWEMDEGRLRLVATDVNRLAVKDIVVHSSVQGSALVPVRALREIANIFGNNEEEKLKVQVTDRLIFVEGSGISFSSRLVEAQFPRYEQVIPKEFNGSVLVNRADFIAALERSLLVSYSVRLKIAGDQIEISAKKPDKGHAFEEIPAKILGVDLEIGFNARFLLDFLKSVDVENILFNYIQEQKPALLQCEGRTDYQYIVMPLKLSA